MGKKKKTLKTDRERFIREQVNFIIHGEKEIENEDLLRSDAILEPSFVVKEIEARVKRGDRKHDIAQYRHDVLKDVMTYLKIPGRSEYNTKMDMAKVIVKYFKKKHNL